MNLNDVEASILHKENALNNALSSFIQAYGLDSHIDVLSIELYKLSKNEDTQQNRVNILIHKNSRKLALESREACLERGAKCLETYFNAKPKIDDGAPTTTESTNRV